jgi:hypothetical protein
MMMEEERPPPFSPSPAPLPPPPSHLEYGHHRIRKGARVQGDLDVALAGLDVDAAVCDRRERKERWVRESASARRGVKGGDRRVLLRDISPPLAPHLQRPIPTRLTQASASPPWCCVDMWERVRTW